MASVRANHRGCGVELPDLSRIVETHVPLCAIDMSGCLDQLRRDFLPHIRKLQADGQLRWFSFLLHPAGQLLGFDQNDQTPVIHLRLEPAPGLDLEGFMKQLPPHFKKPVLRPLSNFDGPDGSLLANGDWAYGWGIVGESSEWVLCFLEAHPGDVPPVQVARFLHYISNALALGGQFAYIPSELRF